MNISVKNCLLLKARIDIAVPVLYILIWDQKLLKKSVNLILPQQN